MISVTRKIHMPSVVDSRCCSMFAKWCCSECWATASVLTANGDLLRHLVVFVGFPRYDGSFIEVESRRRRGGHPFQSNGVPWIVAGQCAVTQRPQQINERQQVSDSKDGSARAGEHVQHLELTRVRVILTRHTDIAENELRQESQVEANEDQPCGDTSPGLGIHAAGDLGPPEMDSGQV